MPENSDILGCEAVSVDEWFTMFEGGKYCLYTEALRSPRLTDIICGLLNPYT
jgi:hypothetical protein